MNVPGIPRRSRALREEGKRCGGKKIGSGVRGSGFGIGVDDFGTGYSSLASLHKFAIDVLKIDRSFIRNLSDRPDYAAVVHAIVSLADNLGIGVVAEGIESPEQLAELQALGCSLAQGFYFARPMGADDAESWAMRWRHRRASA